MDLLPLFFDIRRQPCLVVGGGETAARKVNLLLRAQAQVTVVAPALGHSLTRILSEGRITHVARPFSQQDISEQRLVVAATNDDAVNRSVSALARAERIPVNVVDQPHLCTCTFPSIVDRSPVVAAISTGGAAPVLARLLRARLETLLPTALGRLAVLAAELRHRVKARIQQPAERRRFWEWVLQGPISELVLAGHEGDARARLEAALASGEALPRASGEVYLVGAGPGDPDLLTFRALRLMQQADVVLYDRLVNPELLELVRRDAEHIFVGKECDNHAMQQAEITTLLVQLAGEGKRVLRLKGGDPFIFGRGGEEIESLADNGIPFQVVPGITAASGCAAYAGIPLTHRDLAQTCILITGHLTDTTLDLPWDILARTRQTVVFYMGLKGLPIICRQLVAHGLSANTPAALIQQGTTRRQRALVGNLGTLPETAARAQPRPPSLLIVGKTVDLQAKLRWFEPEEVKQPCAPPGIFHGQTPGLDKGQR